MNFKQGDRVRISVYPHFVLALGVVVEGGVEIIDKEIRKELESSRMSVIAQWDEIFEIEKEGDQ